MRSGGLFAASGGLAVILFVLLTSSAAKPEPNRGSKGGRKGKLFSVFQLVRFQNEACQGGDRNGTCYTEQECSAKGGTSSGNCAGGYGVCCTFTINCGEMSSENCTYFESNSPVAGGCSAKICPCNNGICQLRLDFTSFTISGPSTVSASSNKILNGAPVLSAAALSVSTASRCLSDSFVVSNAAGTSSDAICGVNTGQHLYVETNQGCTDLNFQLGSTSTTTRSWNIKVTQYGCESPVRAPKGCDQWYYGSNTDIVESFNFNNGNGRHLASQDQNICVRRERGNCRICWYTTLAADFQLSSMANAIVSNGDTCGGYINTVGYDHINVPGAQNVALNSFVASNRCGRNAVLASVCSAQTPFVLNFRSDAWEYAGAAAKEAAQTDAGFRISYTQDSTNC